MARHGREDLHLAKGDVQHERLRGDRSGMLSRLARRRGRMTGSASNKLVLRSFSLDASFHDLIVLET